MLGDLVMGAEAMPFTKLGITVIIGLLAVCGSLIALEYKGMTQNIDNNKVNIGENDKRLDKHDTYFAELKAYREADAKQQERQSNAIEALVDEMRKQRRQEGR